MSVFLKPGAFIRTHRTCGALRTLPIPTQTGYLLWIDCSCGPPSSGGWRRTMRMRICCGRHSSIFKSRVTMRASVLQLSFCTLVFLCLSPPHSSEAGPPSDTLRAVFGDANKILTDPATRQRPLERLGTIQALVGRVFDFRDAAERSLGGQWQASSPAEQDEFTRIFAESMQRGFVYLLAAVADGVIKAGGSRFDS